jgi:3-dehydroquinate dehydratase/shikimate dehydrogenase
MGSICISICPISVTDLLEQIRRAETLADVIEIRFDYLRPDEIDNAISSLPEIRPRYLFTYRPSEQGGRRVLSLSDRIKFWINLRNRFTALDYLVDHEPDILGRTGFPADRIIASIHQFTPLPSDALPRYDMFDGSLASVFKVAVAAADITDAIPIWKMLGSAREDSRELIPIAMGEPGKWTRILGPAYGAAMTYASLDEQNAAAPGQIAAADLIDVFRVRDLSPATAVYGVIAGDTSYSMSPYIQNAAFQAAKLDAVFLPLQVSDLASFIRRMVSPSTREIELNFRGFAVTNPHKQAILRHLDDIDDTARAIGSVNTVAIRDNRLIGYNTDAAGFISPLMPHLQSISDPHVAVVGAGGAARACVYALKQVGARVTVIARDEAKARAIAQDFDIRHATLSDEPFDADILVNATPIGTKGPHQSETIATARQLEGVKLVYDLTYNPKETVSLREASSAGCKTIGGLEMLIAQAAEQFKIWTGSDADTGAMLAAAEKRLAPRPTDLPIQ